MTDENTLFLNHLFCVVKVKKPLQRLPDARRAVCAGLLPLRALRCVALRRPVYLRLGV